MCRGAELHVRKMRTDRMMNRDDFRRSHFAGGLLVSPSRPERPTLKLGRLDLPRAVDNRAYCTAIEDQGRTPWCAAYTAAAFAENVTWRRDGFITQVEPEPIYAWAKQHDGAKDEDGTTLDMACEALRSLGVFDKSICRTRMIRTIDDLKAAIHRFGCALGGFAITDEWYELYASGLENVTGARHNASRGGHAVLVVGYNPAGIWIENSWGSLWGAQGFAFVEWGAVKRQFIYGAVLTHCLDGFN
jgi:hypothetical protein